MANWASEHYARPLAALQLNARAQPQIVRAWYDLVRDKLQEGDFEKTMAVWRDMREEGILPDGELYFALLLFVRKEGRATEFFMLFEEMRDLGLVPSTALFNIAIHQAAKVAQIEKAFDLLAQMERLGVPREPQTYGSLLYACSRVKDFDRAMSVMGDMLKAGMQPNEYVLTELVNSCATVAHLTQVESVISFVRAQNSTAVMPLDMLPILNCFMSKCIEIGDPDKGMGWFKMMKESGIQPDVRTYTSLIRGCIMTTHRQYDLATELAQEMKAQGMSLTSAIYEFLLQQAQEPKRLEASFELLKEMLAAGYRPPRNTWLLLFSTACVRHRPDLVAFAWDQMEADKIEHNMPTLRQYKLFCKRFMPERLPQVIKLLTKFTGNPPPPRRAARK